MTEKILTLLTAFASDIERLARRLAELMKSAPLIR